MKSRWVRSAALVLTMTMTATQVMASDETGMIEVLADGTQYDVQGMQLVQIEKDEMGEVASISPYMGGIQGTGMTAGFGVSTAQGLHGTLGVIIGGAGCAGMILCDNEGVLLEFAPGVNGTAVSVGVARRFAVVFPPFLVAQAGWDAKVSGMWTNSSFYMGPQVDVSGMFVKASLGLLKKVSGIEAAQDVLLNAGIGLTY